MKIGVISDTHIPISTSEFPEKALEAFRDCKLVLHAGDIIELEALEELRKITKIEAVYGNMDSPEVRDVLERKKVLNVGGKKICLMHGYGDPKTLVEVMKNEFSSTKPDIIVFGHSHKPMNEYIDGILFFNPGSATDTVFAPYKSYGIIEIDKNEVKATIHKL